MAARSTGAPESPPREGPEWQHFEQPLPERNHFSPLSRGHGEIANNLHVVSFKTSPLNTDGISDPASGGIGWARMNDSGGFMGSASTFPTLPCSHLWTTFHHEHIYKKNLQAGQVAFTLKALQLWLNRLILRPVVPTFHMDAGLSTGC